jgi:DNA polymerase III alpha subunit
MKALDEDQCLEAFYNGVPPSKIYAPNVQYNEQAGKLGLQLIPENPIFTKEWLMPDEYKNMGLLDYFADKVTTEEQLVRIAEELKLFIDTDNENLLRYLVYLGNLIKENGIVTGVGRGSSVSVYLLYLAGIHKVDSLKYHLDYREFFKFKEGE